MTIILRSNLCEMVVQASFSFGGFFKLSSIFLLLTIAVGLREATAQEPYHFVLGAKELSGVDVYGINQDSEGNYWITSDKGLLKYDGYRFQQYQSDEQLRTSLFAPIFNNAGDLFCHNLSGQIFTVKNDSLVLFHTVPDSLLSSYINIAFLASDQLIVSSKSSYRVLNDKIEILGERMLNGGKGPFFRMPDGSFLVHSARDTITQITLTTQKTKAFRLQNSVRELFSFFLNDENQLLAVDLLANLFRLDTIGEGLLQATRIRTSNSQTNMRSYVTKNSFWKAPNSFGVYRMPIDSLTSAQYEENQLLFKNYFISFVFEDQSGNILLGTFDDGILVIPPTLMENIVLPRQINVSAIEVDNQGGFYFGTVQGAILHWNDGEFFPIRKEGSGLVEHLVYFPENQQLFFNQPLLECFNAETQIISQFDMGAVKDIVSLGAGRYAIGTFTAVFLVNLANSTQAYRSFPTGRVNKMVFDRENRDVLVITTSNMAKIDAMEKITTIPSEGQYGLITDLFYDESIIYAGTRNQGLVKLKNGNASPFINTRNGLIDNAIRQIAIRGAYIYLATEKGFQVFTKAGNLIKTITSTDGLSGNKISDFAVDEDYIWFLTQSGIQRLEINAVLNRLDPPAIKAVQVSRNGTRISDENFRFDSNTYSLDFEIFAPSITLKNDIEYEYRLNQSADWNERSYENNLINFNALSPGDYQLEIRLLHRGTETDYQVIDFYISPPFWRTWWFTVAVICLIFLIFFLFFRMRLRQQETRNKQLFELSSSKLTALQSQMNPHFIFNALNSIQEYILNNDRRIAGKYLGKFADLMRMYLDNSRKVSIPLSEELEAIELYLQLEELRFENTLTYSIEVEDTVDLTIPIPSMFIQPYVENAIKHGLLHRSEDRKLKVSLQDSREDQEVICQIWDNGVGRKKSAEINEMRAKHHQSFATSANTRRLALLNLHRSKPIREKIEDLYAKDGSPIGTSVQIFIPTDGD